MAELPRIVSAVDEIPYIDNSVSLADRCFYTLSFFDAGWHLWVPFEGGLIRTTGTPAEASYFSASPERDTDLYSGFVDFLAQRANLRRFQPIYQGVTDDIYNLSTSLAKVDLIFSHAAPGSGATRMAATEIEYVLLVCRGLFDLLQEFVSSTWSTVQLNDPAAKRHNLPATFRKIVCDGNRVRSSAEIQSRFGLPELLTQCYAHHTPIFLKIREFRDTIVHGGTAIDTIFRGETGFVIRKSKLGPFLAPDIWREDEVGENNLVPLKPALAMVIHNTLAACEDIAQALAMSIEFPPAIVPGMHLFMRGFFDQALVEAMHDANLRHAEGRRLIPQTAQQFGLGPEI